MRSKMSRRKKKILLLFPPIFISPDVLLLGVQPKDVLAPLPVGLLSMASYLDRRHADVRVVSMHAFMEHVTVFNDGERKSYVRFAYGLKAVLDYLMKEYEPDVVGISTMVAVDEYSVKVLLKVLRLFYPDVRVFVGGNHATFSFLRFLNNEYPPDAVVLGEGEQVLADMVKRDFRFEGKKIPGIVYKNNKGRNVNGGMATLLREDQFNFYVNYELLWLPAQRDDSVLPLDANVMYGRGCIFSCNFCTSPVMWNGVVRYKPIKRFISEIKYLVKKNARHITIWDDIINQSRPHFESLCKHLEHIEGVSFTSMVRMNMVTDRDLDLLQKAHIKFVDFGLETLDPVVLRNMNKPQNLGVVRDVCQKIIDRGMRVKVNVIFGHPGSSYASDMSTIVQLKKLCDEGLVYEVWGSLFMPIFGTLAGRDPRVRIVEPHVAKWNCRNVVCELVDEQGRVTYPRDEIFQVYKMYQKEIIGNLKKIHPDSFMAVSDE